MMSNDRRKYPRVDTDVTVEVYTSALQIAEPEMAEICAVINMSENGMRFTATRKFIPKELLRLTFLLPESIIIIRTDAQVIHLRKNPGTGWNVGVEFTNISRTEQKLIHHFVNKTLEILSLKKA